MVRRRPRDVGGIARVGGFSALGVGGRLASYAYTTQEYLHLNNNIDVKNIENYTEASKDKKQLLQRSNSIRKRASVQKHDPGNQLQFMYKAKKSMKDDTTSRIDVSSFEIYQRSKLKQCNYPGIVRPDKQPAHKIHNTRLLSHLYRRDNIICGPYARIMSHSHKDVIQDTRINKQHNKYTNQINEHEKTNCLHTYINPSKNIIFYFDLKLCRRVIKSIQKRYFDLIAGLCLRGFRSIQACYLDRLSGLCQKSFRSMQQILIERIILTIAKTFEGIMSLDIATRLGTKPPCEQTT